MGLNKNAFIALVEAEKERFAPSTQILRTEFRRMRCKIERPFVKDELIRSLLRGLYFYDRLYELTLGHEEEAIGLLETLHEAGEITKHIRDHVMMAITVKGEWTDSDE